MARRRRSKEMKKIIYLLILTTFFLCTPVNSVHATNSVIDSFEDTDFSDWTAVYGTLGTNISSCDTQKHDGLYSLCLVKPAGDPVHLQKTTSSASNKIFSIWFYDDMAYKGTYWSVEKSVNEYYMVGIQSQNSSLNNHFFIRYPDENGNVVYFDTGIIRKLGWRNLKIVVTEIGTYALIDGFNTSYAGANGINRPLNTKLTSVNTINIADTWNNVGNQTDYYDELTMQDYGSFPGVKEASLTRLSDFVNKYNQKFVGPNSYSVSDIINFTPNYQLSRSAANMLLAMSLSCWKNNQFCSEITGLANKIIDSYPAWSAVNSTDPHFKYRSSPFTAYPLLLSVILNKDKYSTEQLNNLSILFKAEANWFTVHDLTLELPPVVGQDTNSETFAWTGAYLLLAGQYYQNLSWQQMGNKLIAESLTERSVGTGYRMYNHGIFHPGYALYTLASVAEAGLSYRMYGQSVPLEWKAGAELLFNNSVNSSVVYQNKYFYSVFDHGVDDWHRTPVDSGISAFTLLENFGIGTATNDNLANYIWFAAKDYQVIPEAPGVDVMYQIDNYGVLASAGKYVYTSLNTPEIKLLVNSTIAIYDAVTYLWESNYSALLPGDLNGDGHVNQADYDLLVANFGNPYTIFDYNVLVGNWGK